MCICLVFFCLIFIPIMCACPSSSFFIIPYLIICVIACRKGKEKRDEAERKVFEKQKVKVKLISGFLTSNVEKEVNKFIRDKKVLNVTFDDNRGSVTATILYEDF